MKHNPIHYSTLLAATEVVITAVDCRQGSGRLNMNHIPAYEWCDHCGERLHPVNQPCDVCNEQIIVITDDPKPVIQ